MNNRRLMTVLFLGVLMGALDIAIVGPALPAIKVFYRVDERKLSWIFSAYVMFNLIGTPLMAKLSDRFGRRRIYITSLFLFMAGSVIVSFIPDFQALLAGRALQGFGAGGIFPVASAVIVDSYPPEQRGSKLGIIGAVFGLAFMIGPVLSGILLSFFPWQSLFVINIPIAILVIILAWGVLPHVEKTKNLRFDFTGMIILSAGLMLLALSVSLFDSRRPLESLLSIKFWPFAAGAAFCGLLLVFVERRANDPVVPPAFFANSQIVLSMVIGAGAGFIEGTLAFLPSFSVAAYHLSPHTASFMLLPLVGAMAIGALVSGRMLDRNGARSVIITGSSILLISLMLLHFESQTLAGYICATILLGFGISSLLGAPLRYLILAHVGESNRGAGQGVLGIAMSSGMLVSGVAIGAIVASGSGTKDAYENAYLLAGIVAAAMTFFTLQIRNTSLHTRNVNPEQ